MRLVLKRWNREPAALPSVYKQRWRTGDGLMCDFWSLGFVLVSRPDDVSFNCAELGGAMHIGLDESGLDWRACSPVLGSLGALALK